MLAPGARVPCPRPACLSLRPDESATQRRLVGLVTQLTVRLRCRCRRCRVEAVGLSASCLFETFWSVRHARSRATQAALGGHPTTTKKSLASCSRPCLLFPTCSSAAALPSSTSFLSTALCAIAAPSEASKAAASKPALSLRLDRVGPIERHQQESIAKGLSDSVRGEPS